MSCLKYVLLVLKKLFSSSLSLCEATDVVSIPTVPGNPERQKYSKRTSWVTRRNKKTTVTNGIISSIQHGQSFFFGNIDKVSVCRLT